LAGTSLETHADWHTLSERQYWHRIETTLFGEADLSYGATVASVTPKFRPDEESRTGKSVR